MRQDWSIGMMMEVIMRTLTVVTLTVVTLTVVTLTVVTRTVVVVVMTMTASLPVKMATMGLRCTR